MNATVKRIVEIMFDDAMMTAEVQTLRDEVLANCQERFEDCMARGMSEDDAIATVVESLKGMEEVIASYPKKPSAADAFTYTVQEEPVVREGETVYHPGSIDRITISLVHHHVNVERSADGYIHLEASPNARTQQRVEHGKLIVSFEPLRGAQSFADRFDASNPDRVLDSISDLLGNLLKRARSGDAWLTLKLPTGCAAALEINTASGDVDISDVQLGELSCTTVSGDISVQASQPMRSARLSTASGDIHAGIDADQLTINTMSGDMTIHGSGRQAQLSTISGDLQLEGAYALTAKTVSGDLTLIPYSGTRCTATINTTSGDVHVETGDRRRSVHAVLTSTSGDLRNEHPDLGELSDVVLKVNTVSGDVTID